ncbi:hypothetical protein BU26DRAFT_558987 [Trematosphaeria pertusa]|uniref:Uncharacterized protein n=1 Tax=Trematosphaeria pertusa TaxID=390896 RepID=A0A6A6IVL1_9PLEO|nr:uncharacterized protein BU26DRAFT_558987 [Trematosphaeria pertusa]KAF2254288.1 hypothetical protein BU26DRAFT_558987 [Trematosphaeria pertusa]
MDAALQLGKKLDTLRAKQKECWCEPRLRRLIDSSRSCNRAYIERNAVRITVALSSYSKMPIGHDDALDYALQPGIGDSAEEQELILYCNPMDISHGPTSPLADIPEVKEPEAPSTSTAFLIGRVLSRVRGKPRDKWADTKTTLRLMLGKPGERCSFCIVGEGPEKDTITLSPSVESIAALVADSYISGKTSTVLRVLRSAPL